MENTYNYSKTAFLNFRNGNFHFSAFLIALVAITIPMGSAVNSTAIGLLAATAIIFSKDGNLKQPRLFLYFPVAIFLLMLISISWSIDVGRSISGVFKSIPLASIPISFWLLQNRLLGGKNQMAENSETINFSSFTQQLVLKIFSYAMVVFGIFYLIRATFRFIETGETGVFFYHELVSLEVNAIYVSVFMALALCWFASRNYRSIIDKVCILFLLIMLVLLSSKNITIIVAVLLAGYFFIHYRKKIRKRSVIFLAIIFVVCVFLFGNKISTRIAQELQTNVTENTINHELSTVSGNVYNVSIRQAWCKEDFTPSDYFPGAALRVYQLRIFKEMMIEDGTFWTGYGVNATNEKIEQKSAKYNLYSAYGSQYNFHNEYIQLFAEVGFLGFLLLVIMLALNLKNAVVSKDFVHISFAVLMISLFLTESFLSRQRGIVFFTVFYCLFNATAVRQSKK